MMPTDYSALFKKTHPKQFLPIENLYDTTPHPPPPKKKLYKKHVFQCILNNVTFSVDLWDS